MHTLETQSYIFFESFHIILIFSLNIYSQIQTLSQMLIFILVSLMFVLCKYMNDKYIEFIETPVGVFLRILLYFVGITYF